MLFDEKNASRMIALLEAINSQQDKLLAEMKEVRQLVRAERFVPSVPIVLKEMAVKDSADYIHQNFDDIMVFVYRHETLKFALGKVATSGALLEFGVNTGETIRMIANTFPKRPVFGFDSFVGLPEDWTGSGKVAGDFNRDGVLPEVPGNVTLCSGWFSDSIPKWKEAHSEPLAFCHIDCDLYSSTVDVFEALADRFQPGTIIVFDEYFGYPGWRQGEHKAFMEFLVVSKRSYRALAVSHQALVVELT